MTENNWNPELYDRKHDFVAQYGTGILDILNPQAGETILDAGCGTDVGCVRFLNAPS